MRPLRAEYTASLDPVGQRSPVNEPNSPGSRNDSDTATLFPWRQVVSTDHIGGANKMVSLSDDQLRIAPHVWESPDQLILIRGTAGTGKTHTMKATLAGIDKSYAVLAPTAEASRGVLRKEGFKADTVAAFLQDKEWQNRIRYGLIYVDEAGLLPIRDLGKLVDIAKAKGARLILQGDPQQHKSVARHGNMFHVLQQYAGLPVAELRDIRRQKGKYKEAVAAIDKGDRLKAHDTLNELGYIREVKDNAPLVDDYMAAVNSGKSVLVIAPTHKEGDAITGEIRKRLKEEGELGEERTVETLVATNWSAAERADPSRYSGDEVLRFHRNSGAFRAGQSAGVADAKSGRAAGDPERYAVYTRSSIKVSAGDVVRITANGWDKSKRHKLNNGTLYTVAGFTKEGDIALTNGWVVAKDYGHLAHGYVSTSHAAQGKTVDRVLIAMGSESLPAVSAEQFYVSVSRGRERATIFTDLAPAVLREAIQQHDQRKSATELMAAKPTYRQRVRKLIDRVKATYAKLRDHAADAIRDMTREHWREAHGR